jgi:hypothetical protein
MFQRIFLAVALTGALPLAACERQYIDPPARQTSVVHLPPVAEAEPSPPAPVPMPAPSFPIPQQKPGAETPGSEPGAAASGEEANTSDSTAAANGTAAPSNGTSYPLPESTPSVPPEAADQTANAVPLIDRDDPKRLVGLNEAQTIGLLGDPFIAEERPPARIWTFSEGTCRLQVFFYPDLSDQHFEALTVSFSGIDDTDMARRACFEALLEKHGA